MVLFEVDDSILLNNKISSLVWKGIGSGAVLAFLAADNQSSVPWYHMLSFDGAVMHLGSQSNLFLRFFHSGIVIVDSYAPSQH